MFETMSEYLLKKNYQHPCKYHKNKCAKDLADGKCKNLWGWCVATNFNVFNPIFLYTFAQKNAILMNNIR